MIFIYNSKKQIVLNQYGSFSRMLPSGHRLKSMI